MIRVRIDVVPFGIESVAHSLQVLTIANVGGTNDRGTYSCVLRDDQGIPLGRTVITDWPRLERDTAALAHEALSRVIENR